MAVTSVLIADSNARLSQLVGQLLADEQHFRVLAVHHTMEQVHKSAEQHRPDVILLSQRLEGQSVHRLCERLRRVAPRAALVMWTHDSTSRDTGQVIADAVIERGTTFRQFVRSLREVVRRRSGVGGPLRKTWADGHALPGLPEPEGVLDSRVLDDPDSARRLLLNCDSCAVRVRLDTGNIAPAVDEARAFFAEHADCDTAIDLTGRPALSTIT